MLIFSRMRLLLFNWKLQCFLRGPPRAAAAALSLNLFLKDKMIFPSSNPGRLFSDMSHILLIILIPHPLPDVFIHSHIILLVDVPGEGKHPLVLLKAFLFHVESEVRRQSFQPFSPILLIGFIPLGTLMVSVGRIAMAEGKFHETFLAFRQVAEHFLLLLVASRIGMFYFNQGTNG